MLYMTVGERGDRNRAQNTAIHGGKVLRLKDDGTVPPDNPFVGKEGYKPEIYTYGHRNPQGLAFHPDTGALWENEHGPQGGDELNVIERGKNYGWPVASYGREYAPDGSRVSAKPTAEGIEDPVLLWIPSIGISGLTFYTGDKFPEWKGNMLIGGLSGFAVHRVGFNEKGGLMGRETMLDRPAAAHPRRATGSRRPGLRRGRRPAGGDSAHRTGGRADERLGAVEIKRRRSEVFEQEIKR